jgi:GDPmannose 4,6-dehydratase
VEFDERYLRPTEVDALIGDSNKALRSLGWTPSILTPDLVALMVTHDLKKIKDSSYLRDEVNWRF